MRRRLLFVINENKKHIGIEAKVSIKYGMIGDEHVDATIVYTVKSDAVLLDDIDFELSITYSYLEYDRDFMELVERFSNAIIDMKGYIGEHIDISGERNIGYIYGVHSYTCRPSDHYDADNPQSVEKDNAIYDFYPDEEPLS